MVGVDMIGIEIEGTGVMSVMLAANADETQVAIGDEIPVVIAVDEIIREAGAKIEIVKINPKGISEMRRKLN